MKPMRLHHVGIVLPTLEKAHEFMQNNGLEIDYAGYVNAYHANLIFTKKGEYSSPIEMIIPTSGVLTEFNGGRGGIAHIAFEVDDVEAVRKEMEEECPGCMLEKKAVQGTDDIIVNFRRPKTNHGILVEYVETMAPIVGHDKDPFVETMGAEKGKLKSSWHPMRLHHVGIVLPTMEAAHDFMKTNGLEVDYAGFVDAYHADLIFTKKGEYSSPIEFIVPREGVLKNFNGGRGGIAHIAFEVDDVEAVRKEMEEECPGCMLEKKAVQGTDDIIVNFRRPKTNHGILVEYVETMAPIVGHDKDPFVETMGAEKGKLKSSWHPMRLHHVGIVLPTMEAAHDFMKTNGLEVDYAGFVDAYHADLIFTKKGEYSSPIEFIVPREGVLKNFNGGRGGIAHIAFEVDDVEAVRQTMEKESDGCMLEKKAVQGTDDIIVNFRRPSTDAGILVEYVQTTAPINRKNPNPFPDL